MSGNGLLSIGGFALVSGLTITALRHYDEIGLLAPAEVDRVSGYRRYRPEQVAQARLICALRRVDVPIDDIRAALDDPDSLRAQLARHRDRLVRRAKTLSQLVRTVDHYIEHGVVMADLKSPRIVQVSIHLADVAEAISFYEAAFGALYNEEISSFQFGTWPGDEFFLLTIANDETHPGPPAGPSRFGLVVDDVDAAHRRALDAGAAEVYAPVDQPWKPRSSGVTDPSGNHIDLYQASVG